MATRVEYDSLGPLEVPAEAYYGASTARAVENFPISGLRLPAPFVAALGRIKEAAARVNGELGLLEPRLADAIARAAREVAEGRFADQFVVDVFQTGSGTSTNMNANEVIANRAAELLGSERGTRVVHPNDHVNLCQSSNDVIPTAIQLSALLLLRDTLLPALEELRQALAEKAEEFWPVIKTGRTHLQDATPIRLGQEFRGYEGQVARAARRLQLAAGELREVPLGGTAVGTGINRHPEFAARVCRWLSRETGLEIRETDNHFQAQSSLDGLVFFSGALRAYATGLMKIANDIRWLGSGPRAGLGELILPVVQPGSSIMPGKVNPVIPESVIQACAHVLGNDLTVAVGNQWGAFELNTMMPLVAYNLLQAIELLARASRNFARRCVSGLRATGKGPGRVEAGLMLATALVPAIGYDAAAAIAREAYETGRTIREVARERSGLPAAELERLLDPVRMTEPGGPGFASTG